MLITPRPGESKTGLAPVIDELRILAPAITASLDSVFDALESMEEVAPSGIESLMDSFTKWNDRVKWMSDTAGGIPAASLDEIGEYVALLDAEFADRIDHLQLERELLLDEMRDRPTPDTPAVLELQLRVRSIEQELGYQPCVRQPEIEATSSVDSADGDADVPLRRDESVPRGPRPAPVPKPRLRECEVCAQRKELYYERGTHCRRCLELVRLTDDVNEIFKRVSTSPLENQRHGEVKPIARFRNQGHQALAELDIRRRLGDARRRVGARRRR